jgi:hypothetical protein
MFKELARLASSLQGSIVRAAVFAVAWALLPFWLFAIVALYLFFVPPSQAKSVFVPFIVLLVLAALTPQGFSAAAIFGLIFWYIILIKELYVIDRRTAYEVLVLALIFLLFRVFYGKEGGAFAGAAPFLFAMLTAIAAGVLFGSFIAHFSEAHSLTGPDADPHPAEHRLRRRIGAAAASFIMFEFLLVGLFMPLDFIYQASIAFILSAFVIDFGGRYLLTGKVDRSELLVVSSAVFALLVIVLGSARWGL